MLILNVVGVQIVPLEDVDSSLEKKMILPLPLDGARGVAKLLSAQSGVGGEEEEQLNDILVLPVHRKTACLWNVFDSLLLVEYLIDETY